MEVPTSSVTSLGVGPLGDTVIEWGWERGALVMRLAFFQGDEDSRTLSPHLVRVPQVKNHL